ncbi:hypothetical protein F391_gp22 [Clostridium phage phiCP34O]|uniref:hypothetical protein n=1 Tax=Clostridium phage phiCP34O TaxID=1042123 RepID=UPI000214C755|nr:hypothetical protein F391_gp22 [Clostridium phage phiCP34O]AEI74503.1 hypothetical protein phi34O_gp22 [Clostridium phage phiCP34O]
MRKSDLKDGMIVETKESRYLVCDGKLIDNKGWVDLRDYTSELKFEGREEDEFTINKVFEIENPAFGLYEILEKGMGIELVWERKREIDWNKVPKFTPVLGGYFEGGLKNAYFLAFDSMGNDFPFLLTNMKDDEFTGLKHRHQNEFVCDICKIHPSVEIKEEWYK